MLSATGNELQTAVSAKWGETYATWQNDKAIYTDPAKPRVFGITDQWLADRANFLERKNWFNA